MLKKPSSNELFTAARGKGAQLNGYRIRVSNAKDLDGSVLAMAFPFKAKQHSDSYFAVLQKLFTKCGDFRRTGSAALDLAYVASGRLDGFFEIGFIKIICNVLCSIIKLIKSYKTEIRFIFN